MTSPSGWIPAGDLFLLGQESEPVGAVPGECADGRSHRLAHGLALHPMYEHEPGPTGMSYVGYERRVALGDGPEKVPGLDPANVMDTVPGEHPRAALGPTAMDGRPRAPDR
ncbi:hypothetical protein [Streptomyces sp. NPDC001642]|uniref:hypothetical protein n=1 Tax=Streptomyces sp. NPDC001642 TaxID=3154392 RepID=UPI00332AD3D0